MNVPFSFVLARQRRAQRADRHRLHERGRRRGDGDQVRHPLVDLAGAACWPSSASGRATSPTSSSPTRISTTWAAIGEFPNAQIYIQKSEYLSWLRGDGAAAALRLPHGDHQSRRSPHGARCLDRAPPDACSRATRTMCCPASMSASAKATRSASSSSSSRPRAGRMVISGDCVYARAQHHRQQQ